MGAVVVWRALAAGLAGTRMVRVGRWIATRQGRKFVFDRHRRLDELPTVPAALRVYDDLGQARAIALDFDPQRGRGGIEQVERDTETAVTLLQAAGARVIVDVSPRGGRHVWAPLAAAASHADLLPIATALQALCPTLDISPLRSVVSGCLTGPGSATKDGGHRQLVTPLDVAVDAVQRRSHPELVARLLARLAPPADVDQPAAAVVLVDEREVVRLGGPRPLSALVRDIAERGTWPATRRVAAGRSAGQLWTGSDARQSVLASCALRGWCLADVRRRLAAGEWPGMAGFYAKYGRNGDAQLQRDWVEAMRYAESAPALSTLLPLQRTGTGGAVPYGHTSGSTTTQGGSPAHPRPGNDAVRCEYRFLRQMFSTLERVAEIEGWAATQPGRARWAVLRSVIVMGMRCGSSIISPGCRSLTFGAGLLDHSTVAKILKALRTDPDGWIDRVQEGEGHAPDRYELRIPARYADLHSDRDPLPSGPLPDVHPIYSVLGLAAWRVIETIEGGVRASVAAIARASGVSRSHVDRLVKRLVEVKLVARAASGGYRRTRRTLSAAARALGVLDRVAERRARYRAERQAWRDVLAERGRRDWAALTWMASIDGPIWWPEPDQLQPPPDDPDPPSEAEAVRLLGSVLDAVLIPA